MTTSPKTEKRWRVVVRRLVTIPRSMLLLVALIALSPLLIPLALIVDGVRWLATRKPAMTIRLLAFGLVFFTVELIGLAWLFVSWLGTGLGHDRARLQEETWPIQAWWARTLLAAAIRLFRLRLLVAGQRQATPGPILALFRHVSIVDNLLPAVLLSDQLGIRLRWVVKRELLTLPSLDVAGNRLPNYFVDRQSNDPRSEVRHIKALAENLTDRDGVLIYPEGTRFTTQKRDRAVQRLRDSSDLLAEAAAALRYVMPPRPGGTLALLDSRSDVLVGAHHGLEGFASLHDLWSGALLGKTVNVAFTRIPAAAIPSGRRERAAWLYDVWAEMDRWIAKRLDDDANGAVL